MKPASLVAHLFATIVFVASSSELYAQCETQVVTPEHLQRGLFYGDAVDLDSIVGVIGAPNDGTEGPRTGAVYVVEFDGQGWAETARLTAPDAGLHDRFGIDVAIEGDVIAVSAPFDDNEGTDSGSVYIYRKMAGVWFPEARIVASDALPDARFGASIDLDGAVLVVGASHDSALGRFAGAAYVFRYDGSSWIEEARIEADVPDDDDFFGASVALDGTTLAVGAPGAVSGGQAYVFESDGVSWQQTGTLGPPQGGRDTGRAIAVAGSTIVVGAPDTDTDAGLVAIYEESEGVWSEVATFAPNEPTSNPWLGTSVAIEGSRVIAGAPTQNDVYFYSHDGADWEETAVRTASHLGGGAFFGYSVSLSGDLSLIGARNTEVDGVLDNGAVHAFSLDARHCGCLVGTVNSLGDGVVNSLFVNGSPGGLDRTVEVPAGNRLFAYIVAPPLGGNGKFVVHGNLGRPSASTATELPASIGTACFPMLLSNGASPVIVSNSIGKEMFVRSTEYFGTPGKDPAPASSVLFDLPTGDPINLPVGAVLTLQGVLVDPAAASPKGVSATNAVTLVIE